MRELLLVRKLQEEENAKKNKNSDTSLKVHNDTADSSTKNTTDNTDHREVVQVENIKSHNIDDNATPDDKISSTHDAPNLDKVSEQVRSEHTSSISDESLGETSLSNEKEKAEDNQILQAAGGSTPINSDLIDPMSEEEKKHNEAMSLALRTKRESLKEFFLQKQPYIHKDNFTDNQIVLDSNINDDKKSASSLSNVRNESTKEELEKENHSSETIKSSIVQDTSTNKPLTSPPAELNSDEKRQKAAANRETERKNFLKMRKLQAKSKKLNDEDTDVVIVGSKQDKESTETKNSENDIVNSEGNSILNDKVESETNSIGEIKNSKRSKNKTSSADSDSEGSVDLDALIAEGSDLESGEIQLNDDGFDDGDDNFWRVDSAELERHLTPSTSPLPRHSPDPHSTPTLSSLANATRPVSMIVEEDENLSDTPLEVDGQEEDDIMNSFSNSNMVSKEAEYEDDEINVIDMSLDTQITPILKPISPSPVPSPYPTLSGGKPGIPAGLSKTAFSHFIPSPLSPTTSSRGSSVVDPDEYETMSNGSYTSVHSTGSAKSSASGIRKPSTITGLRPPSRVSSHLGSPSRIATPGRVDSHSFTPTPQRSRSLSVVSDSSTEESTTSSVGATSPSRIASPTRGLMYNITQSLTGSTRPRSLSRVSNGSDDRSSTSHIASPRARPMSRTGSGSTPKSNGSQSRIRNSVPSSNISSTKSVNPELPKRSSSRAGTSTTSTTPVRSLSRIGSLSESTKQSSLKKPRPQSIAVGNTSTNNATKVTKSNNVQTTTMNSQINSGIRPPSVLRAPNYGGRQSTDSLSSHDEIFSPPESPSGASETDSLTSLASSVSYGSSPGRGSSPVPPHNTSILATPTRLSKPGARTSITVVNKSPSTRMITSKLATPSSQVLRKSKTTK